jgi:hypothetical protein
LRIFENRVLRRIFNPKIEEVTGENHIVRSFIICTCQLGDTGLGKGKGKGKVVPVL